ncbi:DUF1127 domain-containing protein [Lutimaribacter marinistellae]|uniref:DUF1127 domain-containing protein n=1 Tax=Lutimaribacter marinistellae TaxID=1820329 RepID=A0ABV7TMZ1_9RHOB
MTRAIHHRPLTLLNASPRLPLIAALAVRFAATVTLWQRRRSTRLNLGKLDDRLLQDVGLTPRAAHNEARRAFWQI